MYRLETQGKDKKPIYFILFLFSLVIGSKWNIPVGVALKPYMFLIVGYLFINFRKFNIYKPQLFEVILFIFYAIYSITGIFSKYPNLAMRGILATIILFILYVCMKDSLSKLSLNSIGYGISVVGLIFNIGSLLYYVMGILNINNDFHGNDIAHFGIVLDRNMGRLIGLTNDPNLFAFFNLLFLCYYIMNTKIIRNKIGLLLSITTTLLTFSRGALVSVLLIILLSVLLKENRGKIKLILGLITIYIISSLFISQFTGISLEEMIIERFSTFYEDRGSGRLDLWEQGIQLFKENPLIGIGSYNFSMYHLFLYGNQMYVHNTFLEVLSETGILGTFFYVLSILVLLFKSIIIVIKNKKAAFLFLTLVGYLSMMFTLSLVLSEIFICFLVIFFRYYEELQEVNDA
ncbi:O-antigen ligase family protein [Bacillus cereus]|uniref:O-antigen ligase family protein n=1 Tax=Bacillus cereus TaxID=1396 RepID=UPI000C2941AB|nr:O-antigen ligase family protein [Bacillus cereus]